MKKKNNFFNKVLNNYSYVIVGAVYLMLLILTLVIWQDLIIEPHDNLDYNNIYTAFNYEENYFMNFDGEIPFLGGISRLLMPTNLNVTSLIYYWFSPFTAYIIIYFLKILIGTLSFVLLLKELLDIEKFAKNKNLIVLIGFAFGMLPGYPLAYLASASLPLLFYILVKIYKSPKKIVNYIFLFLYPALSHFIFYGLFVMGYMLVFLIYDLIKNKSKKLLIAYVILIVSYIIVDFRLLYFIFIEGIDTIKATTVISSYSKTRIIREFIDGSYHAGSVHKNIIMPLAALFLVVHNLINIVKKKSIFSIPNLIAILLVFNIFALGLYRTQETREFIFNLVSPIDGINLSRAMFFNPLLWYLLFYIIVSKVNEKVGIIAIMLVTIQLAVVFVSPVKYNDIYLNLEAYGNQSTNVYTYRQFYSEELFDDIKADIGYNGEYSVAFNFHPSILVYNRISTLDGYCSYYNLDYKYEFRKLALPQLEQNERALSYFDNQGGRAYLFAPDFFEKSYNKYDIDNLYGDTEEDLFINIEQFNNLGGVYIFSNGKLSNYDELGLSYINEYENDQSLYRIFVYKLY